MQHETVPSEVLKLLYKDYFQFMTTNASFNSLLITDSLGKSQVYVESVKNQKSKMRIFLRKLDYVAYAKSIMYKESVDQFLVKRLDATAQELVPLAVELDQTLKNKGAAGLDVVASIIYDGFLVDLDVFWTSKDKKELL